MCVISAFFCDFRGKKHNKLSQAEGCLMKNQPQKTQKAAEYKIILEFLRFSAFSAAKKVVQ